MSGTIDEIMRDLWEIVWPDVTTEKGKQFGVMAGAAALAWTGLPLITTPASELESGRVRPVLGLAGAERRADQALAARSLLEPVIGIRVMSAV